MPTSPPARPTDHARPITGTQLPLGGLDSLEHIVNVSQVAHRSPFRYPGGKTWFVPRIRRWLAGKGTVRHFVEPFAGGGIVGLSVAFEHLADHVTLIELDDQVAAVWKTLLESPRTDVQWLIDRILGFSMTRAAVLRELEAPVTGTREQAFLTILKNRVYHGGVLADGAGLTRHGDEGRGIGQRWYPDTLARRIIDIQQVRSRITFVHGDAFSFLSDHCDNPDVVYFVDPPYSVAGSRLYRHGTIDHTQLLSTMRRMAGDFLITYDNTPAIAALAAEQRLDTRYVAMSNKNHAAKQELLIGRDFGWLSTSPIAQPLADLASRHPEAVPTSPAPRRHKTPDQSNYLPLFS